LRQPPDILVQLELGGVHPDGQAVHPRVQVVAGQGTLGALIDRTGSIEGERVGGDHRPLAEPVVDGRSVRCGSTGRGRPGRSSPGRIGGHQNFPSRCWNLVALPSCRPPSPTHRPTQRTSWRRPMLGYPNISWHSPASDSSASAASVPVNVGSIPISSPSRVAIRRTETVSGPVAFRIVGGTPAALIDCSAQELMSPCQATFTAGMVRSNAPPAG